MEWMGYTADIIPVTQNQQRKYGNRPMLKGMDPTHEMVLFTFDTFLHLHWNFKP